MSWNGKLKPISIHDGSSCRLKANGLGRQFNLNHQTESLPGNELIVIIQASISYLMHYFDSDHQTECMSLTNIAFL